VIRAYEPLTDLHADLEFTKDTYGRTEAPVVRVTLTNSGDFPVSYLDVDASYNSPEWESLDDAIKEHLGFIAEEGSSVSVLSRTRTRLAGLRAVRVVARYEKGGEAMMSDEVVAFREENGEGVVYTIDLSTPLSNYDRDKPVLEEMQKTWCLQPLP